VVVTERCPPKAAFTNWAPAFAGVVLVEGAAQKSGNT
jgi:hypothetical protein